MTAIAKTDPKTGARRSLIGHSLDVALAAARLLAAPVLRSRLETACGHRLTEVQLARLTCLAGLHDCGKALVGFQANISVALAQVRAQVAATSAYDPIAEMDALAAELLRRFPAALGEAAPIQWTCSLDHLFAGLTMLADWLGSSLPVAGDDWRPAAIASLLDSLPWSGWHSGAPATTILPGAPIGAQVVIGAVPLTERLVVIEASTGTGKTEAALLRALQLVEAGLVDGMYFALPTRAAATEVHGRIARLARTHSPALASRVVRALAGNLGTDGVARAVSGVPDPDQWQQAGSWAIACPKRVMAAPIAVGTIDQAMLSVLRTRHAYRELLAAGVPTMLHHSRYADLDRQTLDALLVGVIGKGGTRMPLAIVATQTAEQSLDIDADLLVSDPAPADVLLQRRGRLGRHRPTAVLPMLVIEPRAVEETAAVALRRAQGHQGQMPAGSEWAYVYDVLATLATLEALRGRDCILVPDAVRQLVETATHPYALQAFAGRRGWSPLWQETWGRRLAQRQLAQGGLLDWSRPYAEQPVTEAVPTRLGEGGVTVELSVAMASPFTGSAIRALPVPGRWLRDVAPGTIGVPTPDGAGGYWFDVGKCRLRYDSMGLRRL